MTFRLVCASVMAEAMLMQEHEAESRVAEEAKKRESKGHRAPVKGEDMSDRDVEKLIVVKQSRTQRSNTPGEPRSDEASVISDGLQYYERELQVFSLTHLCLTCNSSLIGILYLPLHFRFRLESSSLLVLPSNAYYHTV